VRLPTPTQSAVAVLLRLAVCKMRPSADKIREWCRVICGRTNTSQEYFEQKLLSAGPNTEAEADSIMDKLLYRAWHEDYGRMWSKSAEEIAI